ncbi:MAG TPA: BON domain-containing protein [Candidatus Angelobacter sp.]|nr:BON domain-containing protein [Candidatus Angelobacter sp.]
MKKGVRFFFAGLMNLSAAGLVFAMPAVAAMAPSPDRTNALATEQRITEQVRHELVMLPRFGIFDNLEYKVEGGTVTLMGQVRNPVLKEDAAGSVKHIEGVEQVKNEIEVLPVSLNDDRIRRQVAGAVLSDPRLSRYAIQPVPPIHVIVKNGNVDLEGMVRDQADKDAAGLRANGVFGAFSVQNNLQVEKAITR